jgi:processing peptidase subunit alpha
MLRRIDSLTVHDLRRVARMVVGGMIDNPGKGSGAPTVVLQEGGEEGVKTRELKWSEIQSRIERWKLGRR